MPSGTIKYWNLQRGFGFISQDNGNGDAFFHAREIRDVLPSVLAIGMRVSFSEGKNTKTGRPLAVDVRVLPKKTASNGGEPVLAKDYEEPNDVNGNRDGPQPLPGWLARETRRRM